MDHGREAAAAARPTTVGFADLGMPGQVLQGTEANIIGSGAFDGLGQRGKVPVAVLFHPGHGVAYANIGDFWRQPRPVHVPLRVRGALHNYGYSSALPDGARHGQVLVGHLPGGGGGGVAADDDYYVYYAQQPRPVAGHGQVSVDLLPDGAGHGEVSVGLLPGGGGGGGAVHEDYGYYPRQPRPGVRHGEVLVNLLPNGYSAGHGEAFVGQLPGGPGVGSGEVFIAPLPDGVGVVYDNRGMVARHRRRLLPFLGFGACSVAVNGLAAGPGSPAVAFHLFVLLLGGLFLVILHVLRVG